MTSRRIPNILPALALFLIFTCAAWERSRLPLTPIADPDVWAYLRPALDALLGAPFRESAGQCFLYPAFLYAVLRAGGSFEIVAIIQSLLGLATAALMFACWMQLRGFLRDSRFPETAFRLLGAFMVAVYLFSSATIHFERSLRPESIFPFAVMLQIYCSLRFIRARFTDTGRKMPLFSGAAAVFFSVAASLLKPGVSAMLLLGNLPVIVALVSRRDSLPRKLALLAITIATSGLLLIWPELRLRHMDSAGRTYLAFSVFSIHADLIARQISVDIARHATTPYSAQLLASVHSDLEQALSERRKAKYWGALGFNPDLLRFGTGNGDAFIDELTARLGGKEAAADFCRYYYWRTVRGQPLGMLKKVARQFAVFYHFGRCPAYAASGQIRLATEYDRSIRALSTEAKLRAYSPGTTLLNRSAALVNSAFQIGPYPLRAIVNRFLSATHLLWCIWAIALAFAAWESLRVARGFRTIAIVLLFLYSYNFGTVLTLAIGHSLDVDRYSQYQLAYTLLPDFVAIWLAAEVALSYFGKRNTASAPR